MFVTLPAPEPNPAREQQERVIATGIERCPWCDGKGERLRACWKKERPDDLVPCAPCEGTGEADQWTGEAAKDWRRRRDADKAWRRDYRDHWDDLRGCQRIRRATD
jgi:hypothetical protein